MKVFGAENGFGRKLPQKVIDDEKTLRQKFWTPVTIMLGEGPKCIFQCLFSSFSPVVDKNFDSRGEGNPENFFNIFEPFYTKL